MRDPHDIDTTTVVECDVCETECTVTFWDNLRTGAWERESFDCINCDEHHRAIHGNRDDRGAADFLFVLIITGAVLTLLGGYQLVLGHWQWWPLVAVGAPLGVAAIIIALFMGAKQEENRS